jgi:putative nucleotidyltransferase with HDIG domain
MTNLAIDDVIAKVRDLPSLPVVVMELLSSLDQGDIDTKLLADKMSRDLALTAKTLRLANSSFYGMQRKVTTIQQAISVLGFNNVRALITAAAVTASFPAPALKLFDFQAFWRHSIAAALCAKALARHFHLSQESAFMAGLLHDLGRLVLVTGFPKQYEAAIAFCNAEDCYQFEAELNILAVDHALVGFALTQHWKFPDVIQKAVAGHHGKGDTESGSLAGTVHIADVIAHALDLSGNENDLVPPLSDAIWSNLGVTPEILMEVLKETELQFDDACQILVD